MPHVDPVSKFAKLKSEAGIISAVPEPANNSPIAAGRVIGSNTRARRRPFRLPGVGIRMGASVVSG